MIRVRADRNEDFKSLMRRFRKVCEKEGIIRDIKKNQYYEKPSDIKRRARCKAIKKIRRMQMEQS